MNERRVRSVWRAGRAGRRQGAPRPPFGAKASIGTFVVLKDALATIVATWWATAMPIAVLMSAVFVAPVAAAAPGLAATSAAFGADPQPRCTLTDPRLDEVSGLAWAPDGLRVVNDSGNPSAVYRLSPACAVAGTRPVAVNGRDVEDLARGADGTLWLADTGDNARTRATVAVLRLPPSGEAEIVTRLAYPDGPHDAEAMLLPGDGRPVLVTKDPGGRGEVYTTDAPLPAASTASTASTAPVPLRRVGTVVLPPSDTPSGGGSGLASILGGALITGGAVSADGRVVALRTYTDAWLYPARSAATAPDVVAALAGTPVRVPLPGEPQGEALAFAPDGTLLSTGESPSGEPRATVRAVPGAAALVEGTPPTAVAATPAATPATTPAAPTAPSPAGNLVAAVVVGVVLLVLVGGALIAAGRYRRRW